MAVDKVIDVIPVRYRFVTAIRPVDVTGIVTTAGMRGGTFGGVDRGDFEGVFLDVAVVPDVVQVSVVEVIDVVAVADPGVFAVGAVLVVVVGVQVSHRRFSSRRRKRNRVSGSCVRGRASGRW